MSFYNSFGGYILYGIKEEKKDELFSIVGFIKPEDFVSKLQSAIEKYSSVKIEIVVSELSVIEKNVVAVYIPPRSSSVLPAYLTKNGPDEKPGHPIFREKTTYFREHDSTVPATISYQWEFLNSPRNVDQLLIIEVPLLCTPIVSRIIPNNLPDRNLICSHLFGREEILASLWAWIADELEPVRVLAGYGGKGKTSIAYEFASKFFRNAPLPFEQVLWVSAKRFQFRADRNEYMELPICLYSNSKELLEVLSKETAAITQNDLDLDEETEYTLQKRLLISLRELPSLVIVDDVDSLEPNEQRKVFSYVQKIASGGNSKFLLTTRANFAFSDSQCIEVSGLEGEAYRSFVDDRLQKFGLDVIKNSEIQRLQESSCGSPLWTDSILRLMKQGCSFQQALREWVDKPGEDARAAALKKELTALSSSAKRILYVASILQECSRAELLDITQIGKMEFNDRITELQALFLVDAPKIIEDEPRFSVSGSTAIAVMESAQELVPNHKQLLLSAKHIAKKSTEAAKGSTQQQVGKVVNQTIALMRENDYEAAIKTVNSALDIMKKNPDLLLLKGRCLLEKNPSEAANSFEFAFRNGQRKPLLFEMWYKAYESQSQYAMASEIATLAIENKQDLSMWLPKRAEVNIQAALVRHGDGSIESSLDMLQKAADDYLAAMQEYRSTEFQANQYRDYLYHINDAAWVIASKGNGLQAELQTFDIVKNSFDKGDHRLETAKRLVSATLKLVQGVNLSAESAQARACRTRISDALQSLRKVRHQLKLSIDDLSVFDKLIDSLLAFT